MVRQHPLVLLGFVIFASLVVITEAQVNPTEPDFERGYYVDIEWNNSIPYRIYIGSSSSVYIYDENLVQIEQITGANFATINGLALSPDSTLLAISFNDVADDRVIVWDLQQGQQIADFYLGATAGLLSWHPNGQHLATTSEGSVRIFDVFTQQIVQEIFPINPKTPLYKLEYSGIDDNIAILNEFGQLQVWNTATGQVVLDLQNALYWGFAWNSDGTVIATQNTNTSTIEFWNVQNTLLVDTLPSAAVLEHPVWGNNSQFATYERESVINVWDIDSKSIDNTMTVDGLIRYAEWAPDGSKILTFLAQTDIISAIQILTLCDATIPASDTATLIAAIDNANDAESPTTLCLTEGIYTLEDAPVISGDITILGSGATIEMASGGGFDVAESGSLALRNVVVVGAESE